MNIPAIATMYLGVVMAIIGLVQTARENGEAEIGLPIAALTVLPTILTIAVYIDTL